MQTFTFILAAIAAYIIKPMYYHQIIIKCILSLMLLFYFQSSYAEEYSVSEPLSKEQLMQKLKLSPEPSTGVTMRSIVKKPKQEAAISMEIHFPPKSDALTEEAKQQLKPLGEVMGELSDQQFIVEGHTDSKGSANTNLRLSERRAASVKQFLVDQYAIESSRLEAIGKGETELRDPYNPNSEVNRRVNIVTYR